MRSRAGRALKQGKSLGWYMPIVTMNRSFELRPEALMKSLDLLPFPARDLADIAALPVGVERRSRLLCPQPRREPRLPLQMQLVREAHLRQLLQRALIRMRRDRNARTA